jgi:hypothetical protein
MSDGDHQRNSQKYLSLEDSWQGGIPADKVGQHVIAKVGNGIPTSDAK